jgi:hypothetical protein
VLSLTSCRVAACGSTQGQGWDIITKGVHNDQDGKILIVNTGTQACLNADPRRDQVCCFLSLMLLICMLTCFIG